MACQQSVGNQQNGDKKKKKKKRSEENEYQIEPVADTFVIS